MKKRYLIAVCAVPLVVCGVILARQPISPPAPHTSLQPVGDPTVQLPRLPTPVSDVRPTEVTPATRPEDLTIEQLIDTMEKTRAEIAEREKKNQAMLKVLQDKVGKVKVRMETFSGKPQAEKLPSLEYSAPGVPSITPPSGKP